MEISKKTFLTLPEIPAVYTFWKKNTPIYIGKSVNLRARLNSYLDLHLSIKTEQMVNEADEVTYIEVTSDLESLLLEADLVHRHKPKYNILLKDDKHALYIVITKEEFPRVITSRKSGDYGPFPNSGNVKTILRLIRKIFPYSDHKIGKASLPLRGKKPCLYSHLGLCNPCPNTITNILDRNIYKNNVRNVKLVLSRKFNIVRKSLEREMIGYSQEMAFEKATTLREKIKALDYITQEKISTEKFLQNPNLTEDIRKEELEALSKLVNVFNLKRIECFDIAHLSGVSATASMVVLINGEKENSEYRNFKVKQKNGQSDYDSMREIAERRVLTLRDKKSEKWARPNLIIVDGGLGQVKIFDKAFANYNIPVVGIAKHPDRLIFPDGTKIRLQGGVLHLVSRIRDEAHRFARRYHHLLLSKKLLS